MTTVVQEVLRRANALGLAREIDTLTREEAEIMSARLLREVARRQPLDDQMLLTHLAIKLEGFAKG